MDRSSNLTWAAGIAGDELGRCGSIDDLPEALQTITRVLLTESALNEGGVKKLLRRDFVVDSPFSSIVDAYRRIGMPETADALALVFELFEREIELCDQQETRDPLDIWAERGIRPLDSLDARLAKRKPVGVPLETYIQQHREAFTRVVAERLLITPNSVTTTLKQQAQIRQARRRRVLVVCVAYIAAALCVSLAAGVGGAVGAMIRFGNRPEVPSYLCGGLMWGALGSGACFLMRVRHQLYDVLATSIFKDDESDFGASLFHFILIGAWLFGSLGAVPGVFREGMFHWELLTVALLASGISAITMIRVRRLLTRPKSAQAS